MNPICAISVLVLNFVIIQKCCVHASTTEWDYEAKGPNAWPGLFPSCKGQHQSPLNIQTDQSTYDPNLVPFRIITSSAADLFTLENDGHKANIIFPVGQIEVIFGTGQTTFTYEVFQCHWHWGSDNSMGYEHKLSGLNGPLELHIVMWNKQLYSNFSQASQLPNGLAVIGVLYTVDENSNNPAMKKILSYFPQIKNATTLYQIPCFSIADLLPNNTEQYFRYMGGLTSPPCTENVLWTVLANKVPINSTQLNIFRSLKTDTGNVMENNFRPVQAQNQQWAIDDGNRVVLRSYNVAPGHSNIGKVAFAFIITLIYSLNIH